MTFLHFILKGFQMRDAYNIKIVFVTKLKDIKKFDIIEIKIC